MCHIKNVISKRIVVSGSELETCVLCLRRAQVLIIHCKILLGEAHHVMYCLLTFAPLVVSIAAFFFYWMEFFFYLLEEDLRFDINKIDFEVKWSFQSSKLRLHNSWRWGSRQCAGCKALRGWSFEIQSASLLNPGWINPLNHFSLTSVLAEVNKSADLN